MASSAQTSQTLALLDVTLNAAMVLGPMLTVVYEHWSPTAAFAIAGSAALAQCVVLFGLLITDKKDRGSRPRTLQRKALEKSEFIKEIQGSSRTKDGSVHPNNAAHLSDDHQ